jgi:hypothetical protein
MPLSDVRSLTGNPLVGVALMYFKSLMPPKSPRKKSISFYPIQLFDITLALTSGKAL